MESMTDQMMSNTRCQPYAIELKNARYTLGILEEKGAGLAWNSRISQGDEKPKDSRHPQSLRNRTQDAAQRSSRMKRRTSTPCRNTCEH